MSDEAIVGAFTQARCSQIPLTTLPETAAPALDRAFALQCAITTALDWQQIGWKIGCTSERARKALNAPGPFPGPLFAERRFETGAHVPTHPLNRRVVEPEVAFVMKRSLPQRGKAYGVDEVLAAVESVHPVIEIVSPRTPDGFSDPMPWFVVDGAVSDSIVVGPAHRALDAETLTTLGAEVSWNGRRMEGGVGANALGGGHLALAWLANDLNDKGTGLREGDLVSTGVITEFFFAGLGDRIEARFQHLGAVTMSF